MKKKLLWIGDAVVQTGFARVTHNVLEHLRHEWDVVVLGVNHDGDPHPYSYPIYPAIRGTDVWGVTRVKYLLRKESPDLIVILNDPWNIPNYLEHIPEDGPPVIAYMPIDAPNQFAGGGLNRLARAITYTQFGRRELMLGGFTGRCDVIGHGVDMDMYRPENKQQARDHLKFGRKLPADAFLVGNVNRNQPRKRLDLTIQYFTQWWVNRGQPSNAFLYLHCSNRDIGWNVVQLCRYYGIESHLILTNPNMSPRNALHEDDMRFVYSSFDVQINTGMGEGWGLTTHEGMACAVPQIVGDYAALPEWAAGGCRFVPCTSYEAHTNGINTIGGIVDREQFIQAIDELHDNPDLRGKLGAEGRAVATQEKFKWSVVSQQFNTVFKEVVEEKRRPMPTGIKPSVKEAQHVG